MVRLLGEGAAGKVWLVRDTRERGLTWAMKELDFSLLPLSEQEEQKRLFHREAAMLRLLDHKSLPKVVDHFSEHGKEYLVMERVEGPTLESVLKSTTTCIPEDQAARWGMQICEVLEYLHSLDPPIIYRDLKPSNVMLGIKSPLKLIDFGIARVMNPTRPGDTTAYGTPGYAPPEQYLGKACPQSDIYALGATLHQMVTRWEPEQFTFHFPPARFCNPEVSREMEELLAQMLHKDPRERPASAGEVKRLLEPIAKRRRSWFSRYLARLEYWWESKTGSRAEPKRNWESDQ